jgi:hypothetical protein
MPTSLEGITKNSSNGGTAKDLSSAQAISQPGRIGSSGAMGNSTGSILWRAGTPRVKSSIDRAARDRPGDVIAAAARLYSGHLPAPRMIVMGISQTGPTPEVLTGDECWKHLASSNIGRLAVIHGTAPEIFPLNFVPIQRTLVFRTGSGTKLRSLLEGRTVAFETDGLNVYGTEAWSVVVNEIPTPISDSDVNLVAAA